jgi:hypothetical protein
MLERVLTPEIAAHGVSQMLRAIRIFPLLLFSTGIMLFSTQADAQALNSAGVRWDPTNQASFFQPGPPGLVVRYNVESNTRTAEINIFNDFAGLQNVVVDCVTAGPEDTTLIAATLIFRNQSIQSRVLTYDARGQLSKAWDTGPQEVEAIAYSRDDDAVFVLGKGGVLERADAPEDPLLVEYSLDGQVLKSMVPAGVLKNRKDPFAAGSLVGQPVLRVTKNRISFYAPKNREAFTLERSNGNSAYMDISDSVSEFSTREGYHLAQTHHVDFTDNGDIVLELLLGKDNDPGHALDVVRVSLKTGAAESVREAFDDARFWFVGIENGRYLYLADGRHPYIQAPASQELVPLEAN